MNAFTSLKALISDRFSVFIALAQCRRGVSTLETAIMIPVVLAIAMGAAEIGRYTFAGMKMQAAVTQLADTISREEEAVTTQIDDALLGVRYTASPFNFQDAGRAIVSLISMQDGKPRIMWQRSGGGYASVSSRVGASGGVAVLPKGFSLAEGESILTAEVFYHYSPVISPKLVSSEVYQAAYYRPRRGDLSPLTLAALAN